MEDIFTKIFKENLWKGSESVSGPGSSIEKTKIIAKQLPEIVQRFGVKTLLDAPCGDFYWMKAVKLDAVQYIGGDIVDEIVANNIKTYANVDKQFIKVDVTKDILLKVDLILCRDCFVHFSFNDINLALANFLKSKSKYFLTTTFTKHPENLDIKTGGWRPLNLEKAPFNFPSPLEIMYEYGTLIDRPYGDKALGLWKLEDINLPIL